MKELFKRYWIGFLALGLILLSIYFIYQKLHPKKLPSYLVVGSGHIDGDLINLNTKYPGRVEKITIDDGDRIKKGMLIAKLKSKEHEAKKEQIQKAIDAQKKLLQAKNIELNITKSTLFQKLQKAKYALNSAKDSLKAFEKNIDIQKDAVDQAKRDFERFQNLYKRKLIEKRKLELAKLKFKAEHDKLLAMKEKEKSLKEAVKVAKSNLEDAKTIQKKVDALKETIAALKFKIESLNKSKKEVEAVLNEMSIYSPIDGFVVEKVANTGEVLGAGMSIATLINPKSLYLKIFVDTIKNGKIKIGDRAVIFLDSFPNQPIEAKVVRIAQKAEFTPKEVSVRSDRIQRVYAVHIKPLNPNPLLKLGLPAIGIISTNGKNLPKSLNEIPSL